MGIDWPLAIKCIAAGVTGVFLVMLCLQFSTPFISFVAKKLESNKN